MDLLIESVTKRYPGAEKAALEDLSLRVPAGKIVALLGESGSGKTTLLRLIAGLERPDGGRIQHGTSILAGPSQFVLPEKRGFGMVFQDYALFPHLTVEENVGFALPKDSARTERIRQCLHLVGLEGLEKRYPHLLSGGQQQRVALARALAGQPPLLLLDEPFSNLDEKLKDQVRDEVRQILRQSGATAIFVTHDTRDALAAADTIALLGGGRLLQTGTARQLYQQPASHEAARYFGVVNHVSAALAATCGLRSQAGWVRPEGIRLADTPGEGMTAQLVSAVYHGSYWQAVATLDTQHWHLRLPDTQDWKAGQTVSLLIDPAAMMHWT